MSIETTTRAFDHQDGGDFPGDRGTLLETTRPGAPGIAFSIGFPGVWISDAGDVELDERGGRYPAEDMLAWLDAVAVAIRAHRTLAS